MLKTLSIRNLVLVEEAFLEFEPGLTVITGETGAGKTVLIEALRLLMGERADASKVRQGSEKAYVCGSFEGEFGFELRNVFDKFGVPFPEDEPLLLAREISKEGKNRAFAAGQVVPLAFLGKIAPLLIDFIGQHAQVMMKSESYQRLLLDQFGRIDLALFQACFQKEKECGIELARLIQEKDEVPLRHLEEELDELEKLDYQQDEDQALFEEFSLLSNSEEITSRSARIIELIDQALSTCTEIQTHLDYLPLKEGGEMAKDARLQLMELQRLAQSLNGKLDLDPSRLAYLEQRLRVIDGAKKRFGKDLIQALAQLREKVSFIEGINDAISETERKLDQAKKRTDHQAQILTQERQRAAVDFAEKLTLQLKKLNVEAARVTITLQPTPRTQYGQDQIAFFLRANRGEKMALVKEGVSGGEISRLLFCIKLIVAGQMGAKTFVFDEIDAGVGGETAALMGEQMHRLAKGRKVLCVTHFPQVARWGNHHVHVAKSEQSERTTCLIQPLKPQEREAEYLRMVGGTLKPEVRLSFSTEA